MRKKETKRVLTITAKSQEEFDKLYNSTADELARYSPETKDIDALTTRFYYTIVDDIAETKEDEFMQENVRCTCSDCPFLHVGTDARRKWYPCEYASCGESRIDSPACEVFYREAVKMMREKAGRS